MKNLFNKLFDRYVCHSEWSAILFIVFALSIVVLGIDILRQVIHG